MTVRQSASLTESSPLLQESPPSYHSHEDSDDDVDSFASDLVPANKVSSRAELVWILTGLWSAVFLGALDGTIVSTLSSTIGSDFNKSNQASYIGSSYLLSVCCFTPLYGRLADILGRKGSMLLALSLFGSGTILCGLAPSMEALIAARCIAGMGGGGVMTVSSVAVTDLIPLKRRGLYQGMANILFGLGAGLGGPLGGFLSDRFGWRSAFLLQTPILLLSFMLVAIKVNISLPFEIENQTVKEKIRRIDYLGSITLVGTIGCLLLGFSLKTTEEMDWSNPLIISLFTFSAIFAVLFLLVEMFYAPFPVMPLRLITRRTPLAVSLANLFASMAAFSMLYNVPLYFSAVRLTSSTNAGLHLLPHSVAISIGSLCKITISVAGWIMRRTGKLYTLTLLSACSSIVACLLVICWNDSTSAFHLYFDITFQGLGMASLITSTLIAMISSVIKEDMPVAIGISYLYRTTGQVLGVSLSGAILQAVLLKKLRERIQGPTSSIIIEQIRHSTSIIPSLSPDVRQAAVQSYADALRVVFICQAAMNLLAFLCCLPIQENPLPGTHEEQEELYRQNADREGIIED